jgi:hypothetical protein
MLKMVYDVLINKKLQSGQYCDNSKERYFLICKSCFWCASFLNNIHGSFEVCPSCMNSELDLIPIASDETCKLNYDGRRGITLEFGRIK